MTWVFWKRIKSIRFHGILAHRWPNCVKINLRLLFLFFLNKLCEQIMLRSRRWKSRHWKQYLWMISKVCGALFVSEPESQFLLLYFRVAILTCNAASFCGRNSLWWEWFGYFQSVLPNNTIPTGTYCHSLSVALKKRLGKS